ncbi:FAD-dependent monooxygenase [Actinokineospora auranticolor]|uniref:2-polyprenyl-6-methoxyphenol hydroxylase-like FAD-dependent oxidoreductase n=1 Tax=Actinokineospora auranticolor TaxID=155976 RepID=A0A2S6GSY6_9PSEU|nr:FAD-dependent monooxygenase [Actinokineospora auranticolor]PPK68306.1 2-polyprenyl-6-methoxyphenol hydroxylase-like FAD-dependent oxidoreductase [Actinokineospora auranticolor]
MSHDVVIAGGGPNGLMLACELSLAGSHPIVLERLPEVTERYRANGLIGQVVRLLDHRGLYQRITGTPEPPRPVPAFTFGALPLPLEDVPDNPLHILPVPQRRLEEVLEQRAAELGVEVRRGHELTGFTQDGAGVDVDVAGPDGAYRVRADYLVGADGGHSLTRKLAGIDFPGVTNDVTVTRTAHVTVPAGIRDPLTGGLTVPGYGHIPPFLHHRTERGLIGYAPFRDRPALLFTIEWDGSAVSDEPMALAELRESAHRVLGVDLPLTPPDGEGPHMLRRVLGGNTRVAERYRDGRVLLVGDAAHVHAALGGPGLNLGLQDAANLGWKLAAVLRGTVGPDLLDTYEAERRQASERVVMHTEAQSVLISPGPAVTALRTLFGEFLATPTNRAHVAATMAGSDIRYTDSPNPLTGYFLRDLPLSTADGPVRLAELARPARPLLLNLVGDPIITKAAAPWSDRVTLVDAKADIPVTAILIRPDGYVAWATDTPTVDGLQEALTRWFGAPA